LNLEFTRYTLSNGITLIVKENHHAQSVVLRGRLQGGPYLDPPDKTGLATFTTSLMRRGTKNYSYAQLNEAVEAVGASLYVSCGRHLTTFGSKSLAEDFDLLTDLLAGCLLEPTFPPKEIEKLRGQIITGLKELEESPRGLAQRYFREILYGLAHPYGRPFNGTLESILNITRADLLTFYRQLQPQNGLMVVVGAVTSQAVFDRLEAVLGQWQPANSPVEVDIPPPTPLPESRQHIHPMPAKSQADLVLGSIGPTRTDDDFYAAYVGDTVLGQLGLGGRIGRIVRDEAGMAYYARTALSGGLGPGPWYIYAGINPGNVDEAIELIRAELRRFRQEPVSAQELADAKAYLTGILPLQMESNEGVASTLLQMQLFDLGDDFIERYPDMINAITQADIQAVAQKYLSDEVYALSIAGPYDGK